MSFWKKLLHLITFHNWKNVSQLEKWVTLKNVLQFEKWVTLRKCFTGGKTGQTLKYLLQNESHLASTRMFQVTQYFFVTHSKNVLQLEKRITIRKFVTVGKTGLT